MMTRKSSVIYKLLTVLSLLTGVSLNLFKTSSAVSLLSYYTSQSNIICLIAFICYLVMEIKDKDGKYKRSDIYFMLKGTIVMAIFITAVFYHIALAPIGFDMESLHRTTIIKKVANFFVHTCSPCMVILDYFLFDEKGRFKKYYFSFFFPSFSPCLAFLTLLPAFQRLLEITEGSEFLRLEVEGGV